MSSLIMESLRYSEAQKTHFSLSFSTLAVVQQIKQRRVLKSNFEDVQKAYWEMCFCWAYVRTQPYPGSCVVLPHTFIYVELLTGFFTFSCFLPEPQPLHKCVMRPTSAAAATSVQRNVNKNLMRNVADVALATDIVLAPSVWEMRRRK